MTLRDSLTAVRDLHQHTTTVEHLLRGLAEAWVDLDEDGRRRVGIASPMLFGQIQQIANHYTEWEVPT